MNMERNKLVDSNKPQVDGIISRPAPPTKYEVMAAEARGRLAVERPDSVIRQPPEAILNLPSSSNPVVRYLAGRDIRPATLASLRNKLRMSRDLLVEAGMDRRLAELPVESFPWHCIDESIAQSFAQVLERRYTNSKSRENLLGVVRRLLTECTTVGLISYADRDRVLECLPVRLSRRPSTGRELTETEIRKLMRATDSSRAIDKRDAALISVFLSTGLRASEVAEIAVDDLDLDPAVRSVRVRRDKSGNSRTAWLSPSAVEAVTTWLAVRGDHSGALFDSQNCRGSFLAPNWINEVLQSRGRGAGIQTHFTSHDFRRTFATRALRSGVDVFTVQRLLGHRNVQTTLIYDRRTEVEDRMVVDGLDLPGLIRRSDGR